MHRDQTREAAVSLIVLTRCILIPPHSKLNVTFLGSCVPDCATEDGKAKRSADQRELPFVSFSKDIFADLPIQRRQEGMNEAELILVQAEGSNSSILTRKYKLFY